MLLIKSGCVIHTDLSFWHQIW